MYFNIVAQTNENTVITEFTPTTDRSNGYQSEAQLEKEFIKQLVAQGYEYISIGSEKDLINNLRSKLEDLNHYTFSDNEWQYLFNNTLANPKYHVVEKTKLIQEDYIQPLKRDDGTTKNIKLIDKDNIHNNKLQVLHQYVVDKEDGAKHDNRYDVTVLVNGLPLVHIELKRRGVPIREAFNQIKRYSRDSFFAGNGLFEYVQIYVISNGTNTKYYSNTTRENVYKENDGTAKKAKTSNSFEFTSFWADSKNHTILDLEDFTKTFFAKHTILSILTKYCVFTSEETLLVMRPYQITATERILNRIEIANNYKKYGTIAGGGYIWHTTGSGKTLTSFKTAQLATKLDYIDKVIFVLDRKDLDYQTMKEYDRFEKGAANSNSSTRILQYQLEDRDRNGNPSEAKIIITTIQKLSTFIKKNPNHPVYQKHVVLIFDECHRSQFGDMHIAIVKHFKKYHMFGFTGTPIFADNTGAVQNIQCMTTEQTFGDRLHSYTIVNAINDKNVLPFRVDYIRTMSIADDVEDEKVWDINREQALLAPERIDLVSRYILEHFNQKTYRDDKQYLFKTVTNISDVVTGKNKVDEVKILKRQKGFNSILCVSSVKAAMLYYNKLKSLMKENPAYPQLTIATIFSFAANPEFVDEELLDDENIEDTSELESSARDFLDGAINDYNLKFHTAYSTDGDKFQNYYKDVSLRMKNKEVDLLIVVNMFLTGFDATTLNTLWVDKNLKKHGLIQAFSRTNRILNSIKRFGNIVCFRNLQKRVDDAISLFGDENAGGIVLIKRFEDYYYGYLKADGTRENGYVDLVGELKLKFPLEKEIIGEKSKKAFLLLFSQILRFRNILVSFDEFEGKDLFTERDFQDYVSMYQDLYDELKPGREESKDVSDDIVYEAELVRQIEINIDYILMLIKKLHDSHTDNKEIRISIQKAINSSPELRSKKALIETFIEGIKDVDDVIIYWNDYIYSQRENDIKALISKHRLKPDKLDVYLSKCWNEGSVIETGEDLDAILPPVSRFGNTNRNDIKEKVLEDIKKLFDIYYSITSYQNNEEE